MLKYTVEVKKSLIVFFSVSFQNQGRRLREPVKRKERCEEVKVRQEKRLSEKKIEEAEKVYESISCYYIYVGMCLLQELSLGKGLV